MKPEALHVAEQWPAVQQTLYGIVGQVRNMPVEEISAVAERNRFNAVFSGDSRSRWQAQLDERLVEAFTEFKTKLDAINEEMKPPADVVATVKPRLPGSVSKVDLLNDPTGDE